MSTIFPPTTCPECGHAPDDVQGDLCGHPVHVPHVCAEGRRLSALAAGRTALEATRLAIRRRRDIEDAMAWAFERGREAGGQS